MHLRCQFSHGIETFTRLMSVLSDEQKDLTKQAKIPLLTRTFRLVLLKEGNNLLAQLPLMAHLKPIAKAVIGSAIALDLDFTASEELTELVEQRSVFRSEFQAKAGFHFRSAALRAVEVNGKASFAIDESNYIIGSQHQVSPFRRRSVLLWVS
jgi:hypothetical protein